MAWNVIIGPEAMALKKYSPYTIFMKRALLRLRSSGQLAKLRVEHESRNICDPEVEDSGTPLSYPKLFLLVLIIGSGIAFALTILVIEIIFGKFKETNNILLNSSQKKFSNSSTQTMDSGFYVKIKRIPSH